MIELDNLTTSKAVDTLLNFETVTLFNNQALDVKQYDRYIHGELFNHQVWTCVLNWLRCARSVNHVPAPRPQATGLD